MWREEGRRGGGGSGVDGGGEGSSAVPVLPIVGCEEGRRAGLTQVKELERLAELNRVTRQGGQEFAGDSWRRIAQC